MKRNHWLVWLLIIVIFINLSYYLIFPLLNVDKFIALKVKETIKEKYNLNLNYDKIQFSEKSLNISNLKISNEKTIEANIGEILITYSLPKLILKKKDAISTIRLYSPKISYKNIAPSKKKTKKKKKIFIPNLKDYFQKFEIINGDIDVNFERKAFNYKENFHSINLKIASDDITKIVGNLTSSDGDSIRILGYQDNKNAEINLFPQNYSLNKVNISLLDNLNGTFSSSIKFNKNDIQYNLKLNDVFIQKGKTTISAKNIICSGINNSVNINAEEIVNRGNKISLDATISNLFENPQIEGKIHSDNIDVHTYTRHVFANARLDGIINGMLKSPKITFNVQSDSLFTYHQIVKDITINGNIENYNKINLHLKESNYKGNKVICDGYFDIKNRDLKLYVSSNAMIYPLGDALINGDFTSFISYKNHKFQIDSNIKNADFSYNTITINNITGSSVLNTKGIEFSFENDKNLNVTGNFIYKRLKLSANVKASRIPLESIINTNLQKNVFLTSDLNFFYSMDSLNTTGRIRCYDPKYGQLDGLYSIDYHSKGFLKKGNLKISSTHGIYNYEPFKIDILGEIDDNKNLTNQITINNEINGLLTLNFNQSKSINFTLSGEKIKINKYLRYTNNHSFSHKYNGDISFEVNYENNRKNPIKGYCNGKDIQYLGSEPLDFGFQLNGDEKKINLQNGIVFNAKRILMNFDVFVKIPENTLYSQIELDKINLTELFPDSANRGIFEGEVTFNKVKNHHSLKLNGNLSQFNFSGIKGDKIIFDFTQNDSLLIVKEFNVVDKKNLNFSAKGKIPINILTSNIYNGKDSLNINFDGDLLQLLSKNVDIITDGQSNCNFSGSVGVTDEQISFKNLDFSLTKGSLSLSNQIENIDKIKLIFSIKDNLLNIKKFQLRSGEGYLEIRNEITNSQNDLVLNMLNLGKFYIKTTSDGIRLNIPNYQPKQTTMNFNLSGRNTKEMEIIGPIDNLKLIGDIMISNGSVIYPPKSQNLFNWISSEISKNSSQEKKMISLPFNFDIKLSTGRNVRYVTYPMDLLLREESFIELSYEDEKFSIPEAKFISESGTLELVGTEFNVDYVDFSLSTIRQRLDLNALFYKKTDDGSLVTLEILPVKDSSRPFSFRGVDLQLHSDNEEDKSFGQILAKLRYNQSIENLSSDEQNQILQDELLQLAEVGIGTTLINPFFSPIESRIRRLFHLEYFKIRAGLIENVYRTYWQKDSENSIHSIDKSRNLIEMGSSIFLNNLKIQAGKGINRKLFLDYQLKFEKGTNIESNSLFIYQDINLKYNLPKKYIINLNYHINPNYDNTWGLMLEKSFNF